MSDTYEGPTLVPERPERPLPDDDTAVRLLRLAGRRPPVPASAAAIVKDAARAEWRRQVWANRRRRRLYRVSGGLLAAAAVLSLMVASGLWRGMARSFGDPVATVAAVSGAAVARDGGSPSDLAAGVELWAGAVVETLAAGTPAAGAPAGAAPRVALALAAGPSLRLDAGSRLRLAKGGAVELLEGAIYVDSGGAKIEVRTGLGRVTNLGTRFELRLLAGEGALRVRVREGAVRLDGVAEPVAERTQVTVRADGTVDGPVAAPSWGPEWEWIADVRPALGIANPTARQVLDWAVGESGLELRFAPGVDPALLEDKLQGIQIETVQGFDARIQLALDAIGKSLQHRRAGGELWIEPREPASGV